MKKKEKKSWRDLYEKCDGCNGKNCKSGFVPNKGSLKESKKHD